MQYTPLDKVSQDLFESLGVQVQYDPTGSKVNHQLSVCSELISCLPQRPQPGHTRRLSGASETLHNKMTAKP